MLPASPPKKRSICCDIPWGRSNAVTARTGMMRGTPLLTAATYVVQPNRCEMRPYLFRQLLLLPSMAAGTGLRRPRFRWPVIAIFCSSLVTIPSDPEDIDFDMPKVERPSLMGPESMVCIRQTQGLFLVAQIPFSTGWANPSTNYCGRGIIIGECYTIPSPGDFRLDFSPFIRRPYNLSVVFLL